MCSIYQITKSIDCKRDEIERIERDILDELDELQELMTEEQWEGSEWQHLKERLSE